MVRQLSAHITCAYRAADNTSADLFAVAGQSGCSSSHSLCPVESATESINGGYSLGFLQLLLRQVMEPETSRPLAKRPAETLGRTQDEKSSSVGGHVSDRGICTHSRSRPRLGSFRSPRWASGISSFGDGRRADVNADGGIRSSQRHEANICRIHQSAVSIRDGSDRTISRSNQASIVCINQFVFLLATKSSSSRIYIILSYLAT